MGATYYTDSGSAKTHLAVNHNHDDQHQSLPHTNADHVSDTGWIDLPFLGNWENYDQGGGPYETAAYRAFNGEVWLKGLVQEWTDPLALTWNVMAELPEGFRPHGQELFVVATSFGSGGIYYHPARLDINSAGQILVHYPNERDGTMWMSLAGLSFLPAD